MISCKSLFRSISKDTVDIRFRSGIGVRSSDEMWGIEKTNWIDFLYGGGRG